MVNRNWLRNGLEYLLDGTGLPNDHSRPSIFLNNTKLHHIGGTIDEYILSRHKTKSCTSAKPNVLEVPRYYSARGGGSDRFNGYFKNLVRFGRI